MIHIEVRKPRDSELRQFPGTKYVVDFFPVGGTARDPQKYLGVFVSPGVRERIGHTERSCMLLNGAPDEYKAAWDAIREAAVRHGGMYLVCEPWLPLGLDPLERKEVA